VLISHVDEDNVGDICDSEPDEIGLSNEKELCEDISSDN
jgi:hypothetical protein